MSIVNLKNKTKRKPHSEEAKKKMSESQKKRIERDGLTTHFNKGRKHSEETKAKMSESRKGLIPWNKGNSKHGAKNDQDRRKANQLLWYGLSLEKYKEVLKAQNNCCAICGAHESELNKKLHVDHCHESGTFRGLLCRRCNLAVGHFNDDVNLIKRAELYLSGKYADCKKIIIFGTKDYASLAYWYMSRRLDYNPVAFCVDKDYIGCETLFDLPVVTIEDVIEKYSKDEYYMFIPMSPSKMNENRQTKYEFFKLAGYKFVNYISNKATVLTEDIGENNFILENNVIQPFVKIGNNNVFWSGNHIGHHSEIGDHNTFTSHVVLSGHCKVENNCFFGVNSTIRDNLQISQYTLVSQGANVLKSTGAAGVYIGNPAKILEGKHSFELL
jgi:sugar O-acyltransferase (sialic acid O-acetyltransferase NeuD family)